LKPKFTTDGALGMTRASRAKPPSSSVSLAMVNLGASETTTAPGLRLPLMFWAASAITGGCTARKTMSCDAAAVVFPGAVSMAGNCAFNLASVSALQSLMTIFRASFPARFHPSRKMRVTRPPPTKPRLLFVIISAFLFSTTDCLFVLRWPLTAR
jgi:hypothetical protein